MRARAISSSSGTDSRQQLDGQGRRETIRLFVRDPELRFGAPGKIKREELAARRDEREGELATEI